MSIFTSFQARFESAREEEMSVQEYLELCKTDPMAYATSAERMLQAIGEPQMIDAYGLGGGKTFVGPVYKRAIFLLRDGATSPEIVDSELSAYAERIAKEVEGISDRVMLYTMKGLPRNWPTPSYPTPTNVRRMYDAVIMIWPKKDRIIPSNFYGVPENYRVLHALDLAVYYYAAPAPAQ